MSVKSLLTLCVIGILFVIMAAVAVVSPHGDRFASSAVAKDSSDSSEADVSETEVPESEVSRLLFTNADGIEVYVPIDGMNTFAAVKITVNTDGRDVTFTAAAYKSVMKWTGLVPNSDMIVIKGGERDIHACRAVDLDKDDNAYIIYADENGNSLDRETYGDFCLYVKDGAKTGFFKNIHTIDFG